MKWSSKTRDLNINNGTPHILICSSSWRCIYLAGWWHYSYWNLQAHTFETETWAGCGETIPLKLKLELCEASQFMHIIICTRETIFPVDHAHGSSYNLVYWRSLNGQIRLRGEENILFQVFNIPSQSSYWISFVKELSFLCKQYF